MERRLTVTEIDLLFVFLRKKGVHYYDLQIELVDHLASAIEEQWQEYPERSFAEALYKEYKKFGVTGVIDLVYKKKKGSRKSDLKKINWDLLKKWVNSPKVLIVICLFLLISEILNSWLAESFLTGLFLVELLVVLISVLNLANFKNKLSKNLLLVETNLDLGMSVFSLCLLPPMIFEASLGIVETISYWQVQLVTFFIVYSMILVFEYSYILVPQTKLHAQRLILT